MCEHQLVTFSCLKFVSKTECIVKFNAFAGSIIIQQKLILKALNLFGWCHFVLMPGYFILFVGYVFAASKPSSAILFKLFFAINTGFHTCLIQTGCLCEVQNVKLNSMCLLLLSQCDVFIDYFEVVPLSMASGVEVVF